MSIFSKNPELYEVVKSEYGSITGARDYATSAKEKAEYISMMGAAQKGVLSTTSPASNAHNSIYNQMAAAMGQAGQKPSTEIRIRIVDVANGKLVVLSNPRNSENLEQAHDRIFIVPDGISVTDAIAGAMAQQKLTT